MSEYNFDRPFDSTNEKIKNQEEQEEIILQNKVDILVFLGGFDFLHKNIDELFNKNLYKQVALGNNNLFDNLKLDSDLSKQKTIVVDTSVFEELQKTDFNKILKGCVNYQRSDINEITLHRKEQFCLEEEPENYSCSNAILNKLELNTDNLSREEKILLIPDLLENLPPDLNLQDITNIIDLFYPEKEINKDFDRVLFNFETKYLRDKKGDIFCKEEQNFNKGDHLTEQLLKMIIKCSPDVDIFAKCLPFVLTSEDKINILWGNNSSIPVFDNVVPEVSIDFLQAEKLEKTKEFMEIKDFFFNYFYEKGKVFVSCPYKVKKYNELNRYSKSIGHIHLASGFNRLGDFILRVQNDDEYIINHLLQCYKGKNIEEIEKILKEKLNNVIYCKEKRTFFSPVEYEFLKRILKYIPGYGTYNIYNRKEDGSAMMICNRI